MSWLQGGCVDGFGCQRDTDGGGDLHDGSVTRPSNFPEMNDKSRIQVKHYTNTTPSQAITYLLYTKSP